MNSRRDHFFTRSRISQQKDRAVQRRYLTHHFHDLFQTEVGANNFFTRLLPQFVLQIPVVVGKNIFQAQHLPVADVIDKSNGKGFVEE